MANSLTIFIWVILSVLLSGLFIFFVLTSKKNSEKPKDRRKSLSSVILTGAFFVGGMGILSYLILLPRVGPYTSVIKFPSTGPGPDVPTLIQCTKNLYATPIEGFITSILLSSIIFLVVVLFRSIYTKRRIEKDLEDARIVARDVLKDLQAEKKELAEAKAKVDAILYNIGDGVFVIYADWKIVTFNKAAAKISGFSPEEAIGRNYRDILTFVSEGDGKLNDDFIMKTIESGQSQVMELNTLLIAKNGRRIPVSDSSSPLKDAEGKVIGCVVVFHDNTKEKNLDRAKTEFISIASHQLRTPVSGLSWLTEALQHSSKNLTAKQKVYVKDLSMLSKRLIELVEDLLNISRIELKTELMTEKNSVDILSFIGEFVKEIEPYAKSKKHNIVVNNKIIEPVILEINKKSLYNVLQNLVSNGIEYSPENTAVTINLEKAGDFIKTSISNKGPAIPKEDKSNIFQKFYRTESAKKIKTEGTGLGLYIIKIIVEEMGGKVGFESEEGEDTMFWFTIPIKTANK